MIESIAIKRFRGFKDIEVNNLRRITLISGNNNIGKSSLLEAMFFVYDHINGSPFLKMNRMRGDTVNISIGNTWESAFYAMDTDKPIEICMIRDGVDNKLKYQKENTPLFKTSNGMDNPIMGRGNLSNVSPYALKMTFERDDYKEEGEYVFVSGYEQTQFLNPVRCTKNGQEVMPMHFENMFLLSNAGKDDAMMVDLLSKVEMKGLKSELLDTLRIIDKDISDISVLSRDGFVQLYVKKDGMSLPFKYCGDGIVKVANMILHLLADNGSVLLIDEIENGLHYSIQEELWMSIARVAKRYNCQVIATTHSYECLHAACEGIKSEKMKDDFSYIRLEHRSGEIKPQIYSYLDFEDALTADVEVR